MCQVADTIELLLDKLVPTDHQYRKFKKVWDFAEIEEILEPLKSKGKFEGHGIFKIFLCLLVQFMEDLSDRELERYIGENIAAKWFTGFKLDEKAPDHTVYCKTRKKIGTKTISKIFEALKGQLKKQGLISEVFTFVDATHLISKAKLWEERDKAIKAKYEKLNNSNVSKFSSDSQAKFGCKGGNKFWFGYKKHISVDTQSGMVNKVAITSANTTDAAGLKHVLPSQGAVYADKGYCTKNARLAAERKQIHLCAIKKNNMKTKNKDLDKFYTKIRSPYERVFSKESKRVRYRSIEKNQFHAFMGAICFNTKRFIAHFMQKALSTDI